MVVAPPKRVEVRRWYSGVILLLLLGSVLPLPSRHRASAAMRMEEEADNFGDVIAAVGDINGDEIADIAVSAPLAVAGRGRVHVFSGKDGKHLRSFDSLGRASNFGASLCTAGDMDGDGRSDILAGCALEGRGGSRPVRAVLAVSGATGKLLQEYSPGPVDIGFGRRLAPAWDLDRDGVQDFAASAPSAAPGGVRFTGSVKLVSAKRGVVYQNLDGGAKGEFLGGSMAWVGDVDGDGATDMAASGTEEGAEIGLPVPEFVRVFSTRENKPILTLRGFRAPPFGVGICGPGDLDGDGKPDIVVGSAFQERGTSAVPGMVRACSGAKGSEIWSVFGKEHGDAFGFAVVDGGDVDADGTRDLAVAAGFAGDLREAAKRSRIEILSGKTGNLLRTIRPPKAGSLFCVNSSLSAVGDLDEDGKTELAAMTMVVRQDGESAESPAVPVFSSKDARVLFTLSRPTVGPAAPASGK